jgi:hypothetical protein
MTAVYSAETLSVLRQELALAEMSMEDAELHAEGLRLLREAVRYDGPVGLHTLVDDRCVSLPVPAAWRAGDDPVPGAPIPYVLTTLAVALAEDGLLTARYPANGRRGDLYEVSKAGAALVAAAARGVELPDARCLVAVYRCPLWGLSGCLPTMTPAEVLVHLLDVHDPRDIARGLLIADYEVNRLGAAVEGVLADELSTSFPEDWVGQPAGRLAHAEQCTCCAGGGEAEALAV